MPDSPISGLPALTTDILDSDESPMNRSGSNFRWAMFDAFKYIKQKLLGRLVISVDLATTAALPSCVYNNGSAGVNAYLEASAVGSPLPMIDGAPSAVIGKRILVKDQPLHQNGIYVVEVVGSVSTKWLLRRITDADQIEEFNDQTVVVKSGTTNKGTTWVQIYSPVTVIGTSPIIYATATSADIILFTTRSAFNTLIVNNTAKPNRRYLITDASPQLIVTTCTSASINPQGVAIMRMPDPAAVGQTWYQSSPYLSGVQVQWSGKVYRNITGTNTAVPPDVDTTNWVEEASSTSYYNTYYYQAQLYYKVDPFIGGPEILYATDKFANRLHPYLLASGAIHTGIPGATTTGNDFSLMGLGNLANLTFTNNRWMGTCNLGSDTNGVGTIQNCDFRSVNLITTADKPIDGVLSSCVFENLNLSFPDGLDPLITVSNLVIIGNDAMVETYRLRSSQAISKGVISGGKSNIVDTIASPTTPTLRLDQAGYPDIYGIFEITSTVSGVTNVDNFPDNLDSVIIKPKGSGVTLGLIITAAGLVSSNGQLVDNSGGGGITLYADNGDYAMLTRRVVAGFSVFWIDYFKAT